MCRTCRQQYEAELKVQRAAARERRAARAAAQNGANVNAEPEPERVTPPVFQAPQPQKGGRAPKVPLSMDQQREIVHLYTETDTSLQDIEQRFGISNQRMYQVFHKQGLDWRRNDPISFQTYLERQTAPSEPPSTNGVAHPPVPVEVVTEIPEDINKALENMIVRPPHEVRPEELRSTPSPRQDMEPYTPPRAAPDLPSYVNHILPDDGDYQNWEISYVGKMMVRARSAREAIEAAEQDGHITQIVGVNIRSR